jgi:competence protein ComGC
VLVLVLVLVFVLVIVLVLVLVLVIAPNNYTQRRIVRRDNPGTRMNADPRG